MKKRKRMIVLIIAFVIVSITSVYAGTLIASRDVLYDNSKSNGNSNNVQGAIDELYSRIGESCVSNSCDLEIGTTWYFDYTGAEQEFKVPCTGTYKLEVWGAQGGSYNATYIGGYGAYATGEIEWKKDNVKYIYVGGAGKGNGTHTYQAGGFNGGGNATPDSDGNTRQSSGGGATHISSSNFLLKDLITKINDIVIVASGGGGSAANAAITPLFGGHGGGIQGNDGELYKVKSDLGQSYGGTQNAGGSNYTNFGQAKYLVSGQFGLGASAIYCGGGGGLYGGGGFLSGAGGSSYIGNPLLKNKAMYCYSCQTSDEENTKTISNNNVSDQPKEYYSKIGNGYARITLLK